MKKNYKKFWMNSKTFSLVNAQLFFFVVVLCTTTIQAQSPTLEKLRDRFDENAVFSASFQHTYTDSYTEETTTTDGLIWIDKEGYKLESEEQIIVVDGELSKVYDGLRNRLIISLYDIEEDDFAPSRMLSGLDETYVPSEETFADGNTIITLLTDDDFAAFIRVEIEINKSFEPVKITAYDFADNVIITTFTNGKFEPRTTETFNLSYPDDVEIVDVRF